MLSIISESLLMDAVLEFSWDLNIFTKATIVAIEMRIKTSENIPANPNNFPIAKIIRHEIIVPTIFRKILGSDDVVIGWSLDWSAIAGCR